LSSQHSTTSEGCRGSAPRTPLSTASDQSALLGTAIPQPKKLPNGRAERAHFAARRLHQILLDPHGGLHGRPDKCQYRQPGNRLAPWLFHQSLGERAGEGTAARKSTRVLKATIMRSWRLPNVRFQDGLMAPGLIDVNRLAQQYFIGHEQHRRPSSPNFGDCRNTITLDVSQAEQLRVRWDCVWLVGACRVLRSLRLAMLTRRKTCRSSRPERTNATDDRPRTRGRVDAGGKDIVTRR